MPLTGTLINVATVLVGGTVGVALGSRLPARIKEMVMWGLGLITLVIGIQMALQTQNIVIVLGSLLLGGLVGELLQIEQGLNRLGRGVESRFSRAGNGNFSRALVTSSLVFCVGPMTILGSIQDGLTGSYQILATKSALDGFSSLAFASTLGWGVLFSSLPVLFYQGALTLGAALMRTLLTAAMITEMSATGGVLIISLGLGLLELKAIRTANFLPALVFAPVMVALLGIL